MEWKYPLMIEAATSAALASRTAAGCAQEWMLRHPDEVSRLQQAYGQAGVDVLCAPTGGTHSLGLSEFEISAEQARKMNLALTALTRQIAENRMVGGVIATAGHLPEPLGPIPFTDLVDLYAEQALELEEGGADWLLLTGMTALCDLRAAVLGARQAGLPMIVLLQMAQEGEETDPLAAMLCVQELGIHAFGITHPEASRLPGILRRLAPYAKVALAAGLEGEDLRPESLAPICFEALEAGARIFVGGRGILPEQMAAACGALDELDMEAFPLPETRAEVPLVLSDGARAYYLDQDFACSGQICCRRNMAEDILAAEGDGADVLLFRIKTLEDARLLGQNAHIAHTAAALLADSAEALEMALLYYQGRALIDAGSAVPEPIQRILAQGYGAVVYGQQQVQRNGETAMVSTYQVGKVGGAPNFDSLPVAKVTHYPLEKWDYKPYAQNVLCVGEDTLYLRMWAFEVSPLPGSSMRGVFYLFPDAPDDALCVDAFSTGQVFVSLMKAGRETGTRLEQVEGRAFGGEDLQGIYWGNTVSIPLKRVAGLGKLMTLQSGASFPGNFYKLCSEEPFVHSGSCFAADFTANPYTRDNMGEMQVVSY